MVQAGEYPGVLGKIRRGQDDQRPGGQPAIEPRRDETLRRVPQAWRACAVHKANSDTYQGISTQSSSVALHAVVAATEVGSCRYRHGCTWSFSPASTCGQKSATPHAYSSPGAKARIAVVSASTQKIGRRHQGTQTLRPAWRAATDGSCTAP